MTNWYLAAQRESDGRTVALAGPFVSREAVDAIVPSADRVLRDAGYPDSFMGQFVYVTALMRDDFKPRCPLNEAFGVSS